MKQVAQNYRSGALDVIDAPAPSCAPGGVLVRSLYSLISTGTELMKVGESKLSLVGKARARPDQVKKVLENVQQQGALTTYKKAMNRLDSYSPLGYSLAGVVQEVGKGAEEFAVGQLVACAGNEFALHAELNWVPTNLCVAVPDGVSPQLAAFATVGSIALQGVRQGNVQIGDTACVIGLGLVGQLVVQLLVASGVQVVGLDPDQDRCRMAEKAGALLCTAPDDDGAAALEQALSKASGGLGADRIFLVAGGSSNQPVELAARLARDRATVVDIGKVKLDLPWNDYYEKELELRFSRSYGPGRYDPKYELEGVDYPAGYVRWTERRNLHCFVNAVARKEIDPEPLIAGIFPLEDAPSVYEQLSSGVLQGVGFLFEYDQQEQADAGSTPAAPGRPSRRTIAFHSASPRRTAERPRGGRLRRRRELRLVHAASPPRQGAGDRARPGGHPPLTLSGQRSAQVPVPGCRHRSRSRSRRPEHRCRVHRHPAQYACRPHVSRPRGRKGGLRREAAGAEQRRARAHSRHGGRDRQRQGHGRLQPTILPAARRNAGPLRSVDRADERPLPRQRRPPRFGQLVPGQRTRRLSFRGGGRALRRHHELVDGERPGRGHDDGRRRSGRSAGEPPLRRRVARDHHLPEQHAPALSEGDLRGLERGAHGPARQLQADHGLGGPAARVRRHLGAADKGQAAEIKAFLESVRTGGAMPISLDSLAATTRATLATAVSTVADGAPQQL